MTLLRMDNVLIVVEDLDRVIAFLQELGMELEGRMPIEDEWADRVIGLQGARSEIAVLRTPDGHGRVELTQFRTPAAVRMRPVDAPTNVLGIGRIMFAVSDVDAVVERLRPHGAELVGEIVQYEKSYRLCYIRGPEGIVLGLAQPLDADQPVGS
jgi:catechol 2,3-dioxygenase-like lactoylglutathione lyase family enzyme